MSRKASPLDVDNTINVCQRRCDDLNITVKYDPKAETAATDGKNIVLPFIEHPISLDSLTMLYGMVIHECGHHLRPEAFKILKSAKPPAHLFALMNIVEDDGMERDRAKEWRGDKKALCEMTEVIIDEIKPKWVNMFKDGVTAKMDINPIACTLLGLLSRLEWDNINSIGVAHFIQALPKEVQDLVTTLESEGWVRRFRATTTPEETWCLSVELAKRLYPNNPQDEYEKIKQAGLEGGTPRDDTDSKFSDAQSAEQAKAKASNKKDKGSVDVNDGQCVSWRDAVLSEHNEWSEDPPGGSLGITWEGRNGKGGVALMPTSQINVMQVAEMTESVNYGRTIPKAAEFMPTNQATRSFANRIRRYIQAQARSIVRRDRYHGRLDRGSIVKLAMPPIDGGEWNKKLFYDQRKHTMKDTAIFVLVDWSGSMRGPKMRHAADAAQRLVHTFDRILKVPVALATFSNRESPCDIGYIKPWNSLGLSAEKIAKGFQQFTKYTSGNNDADAVNWAYRQIRQRKEKRKLLIVLSDGAPASAWKGHPDDALKLVTSHIEKEGEVELYGVGIKSHAVKKYYTNNKVLHNSEDINETLFNVIKDGNNANR